MRCLLLTLFVFGFSAQAAPDWSETATLPAEGHRANIFALSPHEWAQAIIEGAKHSVYYPVDVTGILIPYRPFKNLIEGDRGVWERLLGGVASFLSGYESMDDLYGKLGLKHYPDQDGQWGFYYPASATKPDYRMGASFITRGGAEGLSFSCATCHVGTLFGRPVFGMSNRFPRANEFFVEHQTAFSNVGVNFYRLFTRATAQEVDMLRETNKSMQWVGARKPQVLGLDTSLAQVALSLAKRELDPYAEMTDASAQHPRANALEHTVADSKPAVWWTLKYKTRWLSDGSLVSGNPVHTNFLWNEIGRGTNLHELESWLLGNIETVKQLTAAVFAAEPPRYTDFFAASTLNLASAQRGEDLFNQYCARCHGSYEKDWTTLATTRVNYHAQTPVIDVGTDPGRHEGMQHFADRLNDLAISRSIATTIRPQSGYVPPPLVGIWARWPYFHNNSAPSLCAVLTKTSDRPRTYYAGEAEDPATDFDSECNGYPENAPDSWREDPDHFYDTSLEGLSNMGHDEGIFLANGRELMTPAAKRDVIEFLKTL